jgi:uncharacterized membrane protein
MKQIKIKFALKLGWQLFKEHLAILVGSTACVALCSYLLSYFSDKSKEQPILIIGSLSAYFLVLLVGIGYLKILFKIYDKQEADPKELFSNVRKIWDWFVGTLLYSLMVGVGFIFLIVPGVYLMIHFAFFQYFIVDKNFGPIEALKASSKLTDGKKWEVLVLLIVIGLLNILGAILFGVGFLITCPVSSLAMIHIYRSLSGGQTRGMQEEIPLKDTAPMKDVVIDVEVVEEGRNA